MFAYCGNNPVNRSDYTGTAWEHWALAAGLVTIAAIAVVVASGGLAAAALAVASVANGIAVSSTAATVTAGVFVGSAYALGASAYGAWIESDSTEEFADYGEAALISTAIGGTVGGVGAYGLDGHTCFVAGTEVKTENGNLPIEQIAAGMLVWAWDEETGDIGLKRVVEAYESETCELVHVFVNGEEIVTTPSHPFYSPVKGWTQAVHLRAGDILVLVNGEYVVVEKVQHEILESPVKVYNFHVEDYHTYYVTEHGVLVHNKCGMTNKEATTAAKELGYSKVPNVSVHGNAVFKNPKAGKALQYITADADSHIGGVWKAADTIAHLGSKATRSGTFNALLEWIGP